MTKPEQQVATRAEAARVRGCSRAAVTQALRPGGPLADAAVGRGVDLLHPSFKFWLSGPDHASTSKSQKRPAKRSRGSDVGDKFRAASLAKRLAELESLQLRLARERGELISRELVSVHVFGALGRLHRQLLQDLPTSLAGRMPGFRTNEDRVDAIRSAISRELTATKDAILRSLGEPRKKRKQKESKHDDD